MGTFLEKSSGFFGLCAKNNWTLVETLRQHCQNCASGGARSDSRNILNV